MILGLSIICTASLLSYLLFRIVAQQGMRDSALSGWLLLSFFVFASTEVLSLFTSFNPSGIVIAWLLLCFGEGAYLLFHKISLLKIIGEDVRFLIHEFNLVRQKYVFVFSVAVGILLLTFIYALLAPTAEPDSLSYHLPRVTHWFANSSIKFYETAIARQNFQAPLYSFWLGHLMALTKSDWFFNLVQWFAWIINAMVVTLIAAECGLSRRYQFVAGILAFAVPQALSQVIVSVNDMFATAMAMAFVLYLIRILNRKKVSCLQVCLCAAALGESCIAKYTSLIHVAGFAIPLSIWGLLKVWRADTIGSAFRKGIVLLIVVMVGFSLLLPQVVRNMKVYNDPISGEPKQMLTNVDLTPKKIAVNWIKHISMHVATPVYAVNRQVEKLVHWFAGDLIDSPDISYQNKWYFTDYRIFTPLGKSHLTAANPLHFLLFVIMLLGVLYRKGKDCTLIFRYSIVPVVFSSILYALVFKWQPACVRLQIPYFMLMSLGIAQWLAVVKSKIIVDKTILLSFLGYCLIHVLMWQTWYTPAFLFGELPASIYTENKPASLQTKIRILAKHHWDKEIMGYMKKTVPPEMEKGYSLFFTERIRQYFGNAYHDDRNVKDLRELRETIDRIKKEKEETEYSDNIALLISSVHGNTPCDPDNLEKEIFDREFLLWLMIDNIDASKPLKFRHLGVNDVHHSVKECFGDQPGLILSDRTRESVLKDVEKEYQLNTLLTNSVFSLYKAVPLSGGNRQ